MIFCNICKRVTRASPINKISRKNSRISTGFFVRLRRVRLIRILGKRGNCLEVNYRNNNALKLLEDSFSGQTINLVLLRCLFHRSSGENNFVPERIIYRPSSRKIICKRITVHQPRYSFSIPRSTSPTGRRCVVHTTGLEIGGCVALVGSGVRSCVKMKGDARRAGMRNKKNEQARLDSRSVS